MRYIKPDYYDEFKCIADKCPDTCCAGWQIVIDEASLERYEEEASSFGTRLHNSIDWQEGVFYHKDHKRCAFLNEQNLCDLYTALGPEALCATCRDYPRHTEEFEGLRELSLSLSCPVAAKQILLKKEFPYFLESETDEPEELADEFEDFDLFLFTHLEDARKVAFTILGKDSLSFEEKIRFVLSLAKEMDDCIGEERFADIDDVIRKFEAKEWPDFSKTYEFASRYEVFKENFEVLKKMELLSEDWENERTLVWDTLYAGSKEEYQIILERFKSEVGKEGIEGIPLEQMGRNLMVSFVYTWFCGAVYSGWVYSKMAMAAFCTCYILEFIMALWVRQEGQITLDDCVEITYRFTREVEHSDINLGILEEWFIDEM